MENFPSTRTHTHTHIHAPTDIGNKAVMQCLAEMLKKDEKLFDVSVCLLASLYAFHFPWH